MKYSRSQKILNLASAILVLLGGFYIILFMPTMLSGPVRVIIGILLVIYFLMRLKQFSRRYEVKDE